MFSRRPLSIPTPIRSPSAFATPGSRLAPTSRDRSGSSSCRTNPSAPPRILMLCCSISSPAPTKRRRKQAAGIELRSSVRWVHRDGCGSFEMNEYEPDGADSVSETHRYFPEWADRPIGPETQHEPNAATALAQKQDIEELRRSFAAQALRAQAIARMGFRIIRVGARDRAVLSHPALRFGVISFLAERLIRRRHLNDVL